MGWSGFILFTSNILNRLSSFFRQNRSLEITFFSWTRSSDLC